jgi:neutral ceramidase
MDRKPGIHLGAACVVVLVAACSRSDPADVAAQRAPSPETLAQCVLDSPYRQVGVGLDAPGRLEVDAPRAGRPVACNGNTQFRYGSGLYDITGVVANTNGMGWEAPFQVFSGLQQRQYARAFAIESPCNGKRVVFVSTDTGMVFGSVRQYVLAAIAADPQLAARYGPENVMLSATHTHQGPAGYSHHEGFNLFHYGFDATTFRVIADGVFQAIRLAHANLEAHGAGPLTLAVGELLNTNINRSLPAFLMNAEAERREFLNQRGEPVTTDKRVVQLNLVRPDGSAVGVINWFGVHPTIIGSNLTLVSSDMKGYASLGFERLMGTDYAGTPGPDAFVAAFAQADEGDASPNLFINERPFPDPTRGGGQDEYESSAISGTKHLAAALELFARGAGVSGPVDARLFHVRMDTVEVTDPLVLANLKHPPELDAPTKRTCAAVLGPSFAAGAEDGPAPAEEGLNCSADPDLLAAAMEDLETMGEALSTVIEDQTVPTRWWPFQLVSEAALCGFDEMEPAAALLAAGERDVTCHAEKPVAVIIGEGEAVILPFQIVRIGNLAVAGIPWEVTTMSARRIRKLLLAELAPAGVDTVVVAGLVNDYAHYLTTREEYTVQHYEGASTIFGPWSLAAVQQELRKLAVALRDGTASPEGPAYVDGTPLQRRLPYVPSDTRSDAHDFGDVVVDAPPTARRGETVTAEFQAGHPRNDLRTQQSYVYVERQGSDGSWEVVAADRDPELWFVWQPLYPAPYPNEVPETGPSTAQAVWHIPRNTPDGVYRLRHDGAAQSGVLPKVNYSGVSSPFTLEGPRAACP